MNADINGQEVNVKQQVLMAIYLEYQKDVPNMLNIKADKLGISKKVFFIALDKLLNEKLVNNLKVIRGGDKIVAVLFDDVMMSTAGIQYVESKLNIASTSSSSEKIKKVVEETAKLGLNFLSMFGQSVLVDMLKNKLP